MVRSSVENNQSNLNSNVIQSKNVTCSHSGTHETFTPANEFFSEKIDENTNNHEVISQNFNSNMPLVRFFLMNCGNCLIFVSTVSCGLFKNDVQDYIQVIDGIDESRNCVIEQDHLLATTADRGTPSKGSNNEVPCSSRIIEDIDSSMCIDGGSFENPGMRDADSSTLGKIQHFISSDTRFQNYQQISKNVS